MNKKSIICIGCPIGCRLIVEVNKEKIISVKGNKCNKGKLYGEKETINPERIVTSTVRVVGGDQEVVSVKTEFEIPKDKIIDVIKLIKYIEVNAPVKIGDVIVRDILNMKVNIVATKNVNKYS